MANRVVLLCIKVSQVIKIVIRHSFLPGTETFSTNGNLLYQKAHLYFIITQLGRQRAFLVAAGSQLPLAQNNPYTKVTYLG